VPDTSRQSGEFAVNFSMVAKVRWNWAIKMRVGIHWRISREIRGVLEGVARAHVGIHWRGTGRAQTGGENLGIAKRLLADRGAMRALRKATCLLTTFEF